MSRSRSTGLGRRPLRAESFGSIDCCRGSVGLLRGPDLQQPARKRRHGPHRREACHIQSDLAQSRSVTRSADIILDKRALRSQIKAWRAGLAADAAVCAADRVAAHGLSFLELGQQRHIISGFASLPEEFRAWPLLRRLHAEGQALAMPVMQGKNLPLLFRAWTPGDAMDRAIWGISEPKSDKPQLQPDIVLAPLLAFDAAGWRIGYGGGYYDRTLRVLRALKPIVAIGLAYDEQQVDAVPHLDYDERLDWVLRPSGPLKCGH
jgi:5-formyltetrahydrofolate cyclo-ligase